MCYATNMSIDVLKEFVGEKDGYRRRLILRDDDGPFSGYQVELFHPNFHKWVFSYLPSHETVQKILRS